MNLEALSCNKCGAPIDVPTTADYVTYAHCGSRLVVRRTTTAHFTEVLDQLTHHAAHVDSELEALRIQNALLRLDQEWDEQRRDLSIKGRGGDLIEPTQERVVTACLAAGGFVLFSVLLLFTVPSMGGFVIIYMLIMAGICAWIAFSGYNKYQDYSAAEESYLEKRAELQSRLSSLTHPRLQTREEIRVSQ